MLRASRPPSASAQMGSAERDAAPSRMSAMPGPTWRWRSCSDFRSASRMKDMAQPPGASGVKQKWRGGVRQRRVKCNLGLHAGNAVHRQAMLALEILDQARELLIVYIGTARCRFQTPYLSRLRRSQPTSSPRMPSESSLPPTTRGRHSMR